MLGIPMVFTLCQQLNGGWMTLTSLCSVTDALQEWGFGTWLGTWVSITPSMLFLVIMAFSTVRPSQLCWPLAGLFDVSLCIKVVILLSFWTIQILLTCLIASKLNHFTIPYLPPLSTYSSYSTFLESTTWLLMCSLTLSSILSNIMHLPFQFIILHPLN